jgi:hypothetical protein
MLGKKFDRQAVNQPIKARSRNDIMEAVEWLLNVAASPPLDIQFTSAGPLIRYAGPQPILHGKTNGAITARSGTTMGTGMVSPYQNDAGTLRALTGLPDVQVWNDLGGAVATGVYVKYALVDEEYTLITADCSGVA